MLLWTISTPPAAKCSHILIADLLQPYGCELAGKHRCDQEHRSRFCSVWEFWGWDKTSSGAPRTCLFSSQFVVCLLFVLFFFWSSGESVSFVPLQFIRVTDRERGAAESLMWHFMIPSRWAASSSFVSAPSSRALCSAHPDWSEILFSQSQHHPEQGRNTWANSLIGCFYLPLGFCTNSAVCAPAALLQEFSTIIKAMTIYVWSIRRECWGK